MSMNFDELDGGFDGNNDDDYDFDNWDTVNLDSGEAVVGELETVIEDVGQYDSTVYLIVEDDEQIMLFGNASIDAGYENGDAEPGDMLGIRHTGETYTNDYGEFDQYEVKFKKADDDE